MEFRIDDVRKRGSPELRAVVAWILKGDFSKEIKIPKENTHEHTEKR
jgi:hypothetical protein